VAVLYVKKKKKTSKQNKCWKGSLIVLLVSLSTPISSGVWSCPQHPGWTIGLSHRLIGIPPITHCDDLSPPKLRPLVACVQKESYTEKRNPPMNKWQWCAGFRKLIKVIQSRADHRETKSLISVTHTICSHPLEKQSRTQSCISLREGNRNKHKHPVCNRKPGVL